MSDDDFDSASEWAEHEMTLPDNSESALRGPAATAFGRDLLQWSGNGLPSNDPTSASRTPHTDQP